MAPPGAVVCDRAHSDQVAGEEQEKARARERPGRQAPGREADGEEPAREPEAEAQVAQRQEEAEARGFRRGRQEGGQWEPPETQAE